MRSNRYYIRLRTSLFYPEYIVMRRRWYMWDKELFRTRYELEAQASLRDYKDGLYE